MTVEKTWREAIIAVLKQSTVALHYDVIAQKIIQQQLRNNLGATPAATVVSVIATDLKNRGDKCDFIRASEGHYMLRETLSNATIDSIEAELTTPSTPTDNDVPDELGNVGAIQAFGMYWRRDFVKWDYTPQLLGQYDRKTQAVNFCNQKGIYLLHDNSRTVYVGRSVERPLGRRLFEHTSDRLAGRWNQFSWFGLSQVLEDGTLREFDLFSLKPSVLIVTLEALLIEAVEPPLNRKRGDDFKAVEYLQIKDVRFEEQAQRDMLEQMLAKYKRTGN